MSCNDGNLCTDDTCDKLAGCKSANNISKCDDANACTAPDLCAGGKCGGAKVDCNDNNPCTNDFCDSGSGCTHVQPIGYDACGGKCVNLQIDGQNCGKCGKVCAQGELCNSGGCLPIVCIPNNVVSCYDGAPATKGVGACVAGTRVCNADGTGWATPCNGQVVPKVAEDCNTPVDDDCNGKTNDALACGLTVYKFSIIPNCGSYCYYDEPHNIAINGLGQGGNNNGFDKYENGQLLDGKIGTNQWYDDIGKGNAYEWVGWSGLNPIVTLQFPKLRDFTFVKLGINNQVYGGVNQPSQIILRFSSDALTWSAAQTYKLSDGTEPGIVAGTRGDITLKFPLQTAKYVEITCITVGWTFLDELVFD